MFTNCKRLKCLEFYVQDADLQEIFRFMIRFDQQQQHLLNHVKMNGGYFRRSQPYSFQFQSWPVFHRTTFITANSWQYLILLLLSNDFANGMSWNTFSILDWEYDWSLLCIAVLKIQPYVIIGLTCSFQLVSINSKISSREFKTVWGCSCYVGMCLCARSTQCIELTSSY